METDGRYGNSSRLSAVREGLRSVNDRVDVIDHKVDTLDYGLRPVPDKLGYMDQTLTARDRELEELQRKYEIQSRRLHLMDAEMKHTHTKNEIFMEQMRNMRGGGRDGDVSYRERYAEHSPSPRTPQRTDQDRYDRYMGEPARDTASPAKSRHDTPQSRHDTPKSRHDTPQSRHDTPKYAEEDHSKDPRYVNDDKSRGDFDYEEMQRERRRKIYSYYDCTAINPQDYEDKPKHRKYPWFDHGVYPHSGGLCFMRYAHSGCCILSDELKRQQSICRHSGGYLIGMAPEDKLFVYEHAYTKEHNWKIARHQPYRGCMMTQNGIAGFWFAKPEAAESFFNSTHSKQLREPHFPTVDGYEAFYIPLQAAPSPVPLNTFLCIELLDIRKYDQDNVTQFQTEIANDMSRVIPGCQPMVAAAQSGRVVIKPGYFLNFAGKLYVCRFETQSDVDRIMQLDMINALCQKWGLTGRRNVYSFTLEPAI